MNQNLDSTLTTKSEKLGGLHLGTAKENGKQFWYVGKETEFDDLMAEIFKMKPYETFLKGTDMVIVDAGAYIGDTAYVFSPYAKKVYSIEPDERAFECLKRNIEIHKLDKVIPINKALLGRTGEACLYATGNETTGACTIPFRPNAYGWKVEGISFDDLCDQYKIDHIDLLKVDVEGSEYELFRSEGFAKCADKIDTIVLEAHPFFIPPNKGGVIWEIPYLLRKFGFITKVLPQPLVYNVKMRFTDGSTRMVPMQIFVARREQE